MADNQSPILKTGTSHAEARGRAPSCSALSEKPVFYARPSHSSLFDYHGFQDHGGKRVQHGLHPSHLHVYFLNFLVLCLDSVLADERLGLRGTPGIIRDVSLSLVQKGVQELTLLAAISEQQLRAQAKAWCLCGRHNFLSWVPSLRQGLEGTTMSGVCLPNPSRPGGPVAFVLVHEHEACCMPPIPRRVTFHACALFGPPLS